MYKTQKDLQQQSHHAPPQIPSDPRFSHSSLRKSEKNFTKLVPQLDQSAHDLQNLKISGPKTQARAAKRSDGGCLRQHAQLLLVTRSHVPAFSHTLALIHVPSAHDVMDDVILHYLGLTRIDLET